MNLKIIFLFVISYCLQAQELGSYELFDLAQERSVQLDLKQKKGITVVNFWATWCTVCLKELPALNDLKQRLVSSKTTEVELNFLAINAGDTDRLVKKFLKKNRFDFDIYLDPEKKMAQSLLIEALPRTLVIKDGKIIYSDAKPPSDFLFSEKFK